MLAYVTPDSLMGDLECVQLSIPSHLFRYVIGALSELTEISNWEQIGTVTPEQASQYFTDWLINLQDKCMIPWTFRHFGNQTTNVANATNQILVMGNTSEYLGGYDYASGVLTVMREGLYIVSAGIQWAANSAGFRQIQLTKNFSVVATGRTDVLFASVPAVTQLHWIGYCLAQDELRIQGFQNSGGSLLTQFASGMPYWTVTGYRDDWTIANE